MEETQKTAAVVAPTIVPTFLSWETHEYEHKERHPDWNWYAGLIAILAAIVAFFVGDLFFGIFLVLAGIVVVLYARRSPEHLKIVIDGLGVSINGQRMEYKYVTQFWLDESGKQDTLLLLVRKSFMPMLAFPLEGVTADQVRAILKAHIPEVEMRESTSVKIFDHLGF